MCDYWAYGQPKIIAPKAYHGVIHKKSFKEPG